MLIIKFFNQFLRHKISILILLSCVILSQFLVLFIYISDPLKIDANNVLNTALGALFLPSFAIIFLIIPLFSKYLNEIVYLKKILIYNKNYWFNFKISLMKIFYFYALSLVFFLLNLLMVYLFYLSTLSFIILLQFFSISAFFLFLLVNISILMNNLNLGIKTNISIFMFLIIVFYAFFSPSTILTYSLQHFPDAEWSNWLFLQKFFFSFYYVLLGSNLDNTLTSIKMFLPNFDKIFRIFMTINGMSFVIFIINIFLKRGLNQLAKSFKSFVSRIF